MTRIAITGPVASLDEWCEAARAAGWESLACPLLELVPRGADHQDQLAVAEFGTPDAIALTSVHALPMLLELIARNPELSTTPMWVVGAKTQQALKQAGLTAAVHVSPDAARLSGALCAGLRRSQRILWPRGDQSDELARLCRAAGLRVLDLVAYRNVPLEGIRLPICEWVFFASPSGVDRWLEAGGQGAVGAIAIGETTLRRLRESATDRFSAIIPLPQPTVDALRRCIAELGHKPST